MGSDGQYVGPHVGPYVGRFAPSPTGALHAGSLVAALASWLDARSHSGKWLVRIEDVDTPRCILGAAVEILRQLAACGLIPDAPPIYQSKRGALYQTALDQLIEDKAAYPCACSRKEIEDARTTAGTDPTCHGELIYPGTCRAGLAGRKARAWRFLATFIQRKEPFSHTDTARRALVSIATNHSPVDWQDRRLGHQQQDVSREVGDFVIKRADALWAYQLAVVVDDAAQGITHIVRGEDLADNTARQILLQQALRYPTPHYLHTPLVLAANSQKLSKQTGAQALDLATPQSVMQHLHQAAEILHLPKVQANTPAEALQHWTLAWPMCPLRPPRPPSL